MNAQINLVNYDNSRIAGAYVALTVDTILITYQAKPLESLKSAYKNADRRARIARNLIQMGRYAAPLTDDNGFFLHQDIARVERGSRNLTYIIEHSGNIMSGGVVAYSHWRYAMNRKGANNA